jgi:kynureninase
VLRSAVKAAKRPEVKTPESGPDTPSYSVGVDLAPHYSRFRVTERTLLTGHSHQAWPDVSFDAQQRAWLDAATLVDDKWERAAAVADEVCAGWRRLLNDGDGDIALGQNTHELVVRLLSAVIDPRRPARLITTDGEFHTIRRQLDRLAEMGIEVLKVPARPADTLAERLATRIDERVTCVLVSSVLYETAEIVPGLARIAEACTRHGAELLVDAYHHVNVVPFDVRTLGLERAFITGGGYKYCQLGEGNCFLRIPPGCRLRPVLTGWFSEFAELAAARTPGEVRYGSGAARFAGSTYDPTAHYRAAAVFAFHRDLELTPERLRQISLRQIALLERDIRALDIDPTVAALAEVSPERRAGFLALQTPHAAQAVRALRGRGVFVDARGSVLRLGPAPYLADDQLRAGASDLGEVLRELSGNPID